MDDNNRLIHSFHLNSKRYSFKLCPKIQFLQIFFHQRFFLATDLEHCRITITYGYVKLKKIELSYRIHLKFNLSDTHISWKGYLIGSLTPKINIHLMAYKKKTDSPVGKPRTDSVPPTMQSQIPKSRDVTLFFLDMTLYK